MFRQSQKVSSISASAASTASEASAHQQNQQNQENFFYLKVNKSTQCVLHIGVTRSVNPDQCDKMGPVHGKGARWSNWSQACFDICHCCSASLNITINQICSGDQALIPQLSLNNINLTNRHRAQRRESVLVRADNGIVVSMVLQYCGILWYCGVNGMKYKSGGSVLTTIFAVDTNGTVCTVHCEWASA